MNIEPTKIAAGESLNWVRSLVAYPAGAGYVLHYALFNETESIVIDGTADGDKHVIDVGSAITEPWAPGRYDWSAYVTGPADFKRSLFGGSIIITPDLAAGPYDGRSHAQIMLSAIEACLEKRASAQELDLVKAQFGERAVERDMAILTEKRKEYRSEVAGENRKAARLRGERVSNNTKLKFTR